jgi:hypothetical protein
MKPSNPSSPSTPESLLSQPSSFEGRPAETPRFNTGSVKEMAGDAKRAAGNALTQAKERAASMAQEQKKSAADHIGRYSSALRDSARSVEEEDPNVAYYANMAAERIERIADYVRSTDLAGLQHDAEDIARRHPALFMGGMFLAGIVLGGLVKTSARIMREDNSSSPDPFDPMGDNPSSPVFGSSLGGSTSPAANI